MIHSMVAHLDAVTSLAIDPNGLYLLSGSKYEPLVQKICVFCDNQGNVMLVSP